MAKKRAGGQHVTPRTTIQIPVPWLELAKKLAKLNKQPTLWHVMSLLAADADLQGVERPALPWEEGEQPAAKKQ